MLRRAVAMRRRDHAPPLLCLVRAHGARFGCGGPLVRRQPVRAGDHRLESGDEVRPDGGVAVGGVGVVADQEPLVVADLDFLDPQVRGHVLVAAGPGRRRAGLRGAGAQLLTQDVAVPAGGQVAAVLLRGEPAVGHPDHLPQGPVPQVVFDLPDHGESLVLPGRPHRTGIPSRVTAIPTTTWGRSSRESLDLPWVRKPAWPTAPSGGSSRAVRAVGAAAVGLDTLAAVVTPTGSSAWSVSKYVEVGSDVVLCVLAHTVCAALRRRLPGYATATPDTLQRRFLTTGGHVLARRNEIVVRLDRRTYSPVLRQANLPPHLTTPWLDGRTLRYEYA